MNKILTLIALMFLTSVAHAGSVSFQWEVPSEREDGTTLLYTEISGYTLYEDGYQVAWISGGLTTEFTYEYDGYGQPCFSISTTDSWQQEGNRSEEVCVNVYPAPPSAPIFLEVR